MIKGFSRLSREEKRNYIITNLKGLSLNNFLSTLPKNQKIENLMEDFSENVISVFPFPYSVAPNFLIDGKEYLVPFVTEESSVVAAAAKSASFWFSRGGFKTELVGTIKNGQIHLITNIDPSIMHHKVKSWETQIFSAVSDLDAKMKKRGGGIQSIKLMDKSEELENYLQLDISFDTCNAMGANYMNSCLEGIAQKLSELVDQDENLDNYHFEVVMSILSNYSPGNAVKIFVECPVAQLDDGKLGMSPENFAHKFVRAIKIAQIDVSRAVTHNKGMYNGIDSVALATGNDWRAIEANGHAYASRDGQYSSLSSAWINEEQFHFEATIPLQVGTVGGITALHPLAQVSLKILENPTSEELMKVMAAAGLASNFAAVKALTTTGIQKGHMKMHLSNIISALGANEEEGAKIKAYFAQKTVSNSAVEEYLQNLRSN